MSALVLFTCLALPFGSEIFFSHFLSHFLQIKSVAHMFAFIRISAPHGHQFGHIPLCPNKSGEFSLAQYRDQDISVERPSNLKKKKSSRDCKRLPLVHLIRLLSSSFSPTNMAQVQFCHNFSFVALSVFGVVTFLLLSQFDILFSFVTI